ncbi:MAG: NUDIX hydrolase [Elusimicrobiota bacterium]|jgi:ADP-ribose pyrophosphatase YjhB (NUDIX family)
MRKIFLPDFYYLESDGQVFLVKKKGLWRFPSRRREIPFRFTPVLIIPHLKNRIQFAIPILKHHPDRWFHKDDLIGRQEVDPIVQQAVNRSLPRGAAKVAVIEKGKVLMVKAARGLTKGYWNLPGGFMGYGEHPTESARREVFEELGIRVRLTKLLGIYSDVFPQTGGYMLSFVYLGKRRPGPIKPHPEEIETYTWMPVRQALRSTLNPFAKAGLRDYRRKPSARHPRVL